MDSDEDDVGPSRRPGAGPDDDPDTEDELEKIRERTNGEWWVLASAHFDCLLG